MYVPIVPQWLNACCTLRRCMVIGMCAGLYGKQQNRQNKRPSKSRRPINGQCHGLMMVSQSTSRPLQ